MFEEMIFLNINKVTCTEAVLLFFKNHQFSFCLAIMPNQPAGLARAKTSRKVERTNDEAETARILKKRTLILGETSDGEESVEEVKQESTMEKIDRLFPGWWEQDQHLAECGCDFCKLMFGRQDDASNARPLQGTIIMSTPRQRDHMLQDDSPKSPTAA